MGAFPVGVLTLFFYHHSIIHEGKIPFTRVRCIEGFLHQREDFAVFDVVLVFKEAMDEDPPYVRFYKDDGLIEGEGGNCTGGCPADSRKGH